MQAIGTFLGGLVRLAAIIGTLSVAALMCLTVVTVTFRFLGIAFPGTYVLAELLIMPAVTFALAYTAWAGAHTKVDLLTNTLPRRIADPLVGVMLAIGAGFWGMVATAGVEEVLRRQAQGETTPFLDIPVAPFRWMMVGAVSLLVAVLLYRAVETALGRESRT